MGIISTLRSILRVADDRPTRSGDGGTSIAVDREPEAAGERAVKGGHARLREASEEESGGDDVPDDRGEPVESIKGIGPAYAGQLEAAGVRTVEDLAGADPDDLAAATDIGTGRLGNWIERARAQTR